MLRAPTLLSFRQVARGSFAAVDAAKDLREHSQMPRNRRLLRVGLKHLGVVCRHVHCRVLHVELLHPQRRLRQLTRWLRYGTHLVGPLRIRVHVRAERFPVHELAGVNGLHRNQPAQGKARDLCWIHVGLPLRTQPDYIRATFLFIYGFWIILISIYLHLTSPLTPRALGAAQRQSAGVIANSSELLMQYP